MAKVKFQGMRREGEFFLEDTDPLLRKPICVHGPRRLSSYWKNQDHKKDTMIVPKALASIDSRCAP